jgi:TRAP-type uncharacterized transport system substrate-binding protein
LTPVRRNSSIIDISTPHQVKILSIDPANIKKINKNIRILRCDHYPKGTYKGIDETSPPPVPCYFVASEPTFRRLVYNMTKV